eukprot:GHUV01009210.1.p1 GENE.GHUV01009210.1~~GHUV01009210.1.p1  ORF type:complete len:234 (+),score=52.20 GHUV01009210.1:186-887(+)
MGNVKDATDKAQTALDKGIEQAATSAKTGLASAASVARDFLAQVEAYWDTAKAHAAATLGQAEELQDQAFTQLKEGVEYCILHPYISYPAAAGLTLVALPGVRRFTYRVTLGRLRNPEAVVSSAEAKLSSIAARTEEYSAESKKLQERAQLAYDEWTRGYQKLKATRQELQRLESSVGKSERVAHNVITDLRAMRQNTRATELRSEVCGCMDITNFAIVYSLLFRSCAIVACP